MTPTEPIIRMRNVVKCYPGPDEDIVALGGIGLTVEPGEVFGLLGPNGSGKTTSIEIIAGLRRVSAGEVRTVGLDPFTQRTEVRRVVSIQPQQAAVFDQQTVSELLRVWASLYPEPDEVDAIIARMGLQSSRNIRIAKLSGGQQQRLLVGLALISHPRLLILDEPSTGMDPNARQELWTALRDYRESGGTVLLSTHSMEEAEILCDRVAVLHRGELVACAAPQDLVRTYAPGREITFTVEAGHDLHDLAVHTSELTTTATGTEGDVRVRLRTLDSDAVFTMITGRLRARQIEVKDGGLESVFRRLTGYAFDDVHTVAEDRTTTDQQVMAS